MCKSRVSFEAVLKTRLGDPSVTSGGRARPCEVLGDLWNGLLEKNGVTSGTQNTAGWLLEKKAVFGGGQRTARGSLGTSHLAFKEKGHFVYPNLMYYPAPKWSQMRD